MKKILFVCDGSNFSNGAFEFLKMMHENAPISVTGIFFTPVDFQQLVSISYIPVAEPYVKLKEKEKIMVEESRELFVKKCASSGITHSTILENQEWNGDLFARETRFADIVLMSGELFCAELSNYQPNVFMQEALRKAECPVILVPEHFKALDRIVIAYDGKKESMFALKQFCYLFAQFSELPAEFVYVKDEENEIIPDQESLKEYARLHFSSLGVAKLHFDARKHFSAWTDDKKNSLLVAGAFSRAGVSNLLKTSFAEKVVHDHNIPVFIAHNS